jgi:O-antigen/teichoic acid export membrane protein
VAKKITTNHRIFSSLQWTYLSFATSGILQMVMLAVMARLISPIEFGILASALVTIRAGHTLVQSGYERAVIWSENQSASIHAGLFWVAVATGLSLTFIFLLLAWPVATFFRNDNIAYVLFALSPMPTLASIGLVARGILRRAMNYRLLAIQETASYALGYGVVGLTFALLHFGVWSLVLANLAQSALQGLLPLLFVRHRVFAQLDIGAIGKSLKFGYSVSMLGLIEFIDAQVTSVFVGRFIGLSSLGIYNRAYTLVHLPLEQLGSSLSKVLYSSFSLSKDNVSQLRLILMPALRLLALIVFPIAAGGAAAAKPIVGIILGSNWDATAPIFAVLSIGAACGVVANIIAVLNEALNLIFYKAVLQICLTLILVTSLFYSYQYGLLFSALCFSMCRLMFLVGQIILATSALKLKATELLVPLLPGFVISIFIFGTLETISYMDFWRQQTIFVQGGSAILISLSLLIAFIGFFLPKERRLLTAGLNELSMKFRAVI